MQNKQVSKKQSLGQIWQKSSWNLRLTAAGTALTAVGASLPWYSDVDMLRSGDVYSGLSGPLYVMGYSMLALSLANLALTLSKELKIKIAGFDLSEVDIGKWQMINSALTFYLLFAANAVFFHPGFGLNILAKTSEYGSWITLAGTMVMLVGGYTAKFKKVKTAAVKTPVEEVVLQQNPEPQVNTINRAHAGIEAIKPNPLRQKTEKVAAAKTEQSDPAKYYAQMKRMMEKETRRATQAQVSDSPLQDKIVPNNWYRPGL